MLAQHRIFIIGGGLAGGLLAYRLWQKGLRNFALCERGERIGGHHTWSFHDHDLLPSEHEWMKELVSARWSRHEVRFATYNRFLNTGYNSIRSTDFHQLLMSKFGENVQLNTLVEIKSPTEVLLNGQKRRADVVIDARGTWPVTCGTGYQKFFGLNLEFSEPHGLSHAILMDATVKQLDGYRFFYVLPWDERRMLIEDTRYSNTDEMRLDQFREEICAYAGRQFKLPFVIQSEEHAALPIPHNLCLSSSTVPRLGIAAGMFHPTTGYSLPWAVHQVHEIVERLVVESELNLDLDWQTVAHEMQVIQKKLSSGMSYYKFLNRLMFRAATPEARWRIFERFYKFPEPVIQRFYAGTSLWRDRLRLLVGRPPVPVGEALKALWTKAPA